MFIYVAFKLSVGLGAFFVSYLLTYSLTYSLTYLCITYPLTYLLMYVCMYVCMPSILSGWEWGFQCFRVNADGMCFMK